MKLLSLEAAMSATNYPGRGIVVGKSEDGKKAVAAYFIMGRSENSRNRVFVADGDGLRTQAFDPAKLKDPSLIIYAPVRVFGEHTVVTNGDQTDTVCEHLQGGGTFESALRTREFEPDAPNYTPRVSAMLSVKNGAFGYRMGILKSDEGDPAQCVRAFYEYESPRAGEGRFLHTYLRDGSPIPSFEGEPERVTLTGDIDQVTKTIWDSLDENNRVSLFVRFIDLQSGAREDRIVNKNA